MKIRYIVERNDEPYRLGIKVMKRGVRCYQFDGTKPCDKPENKRQV